MCNYNGLRRWHAVCFHKNKTSPIKIEIIHMFRIAFGLLALILITSGHPALAAASATATSSSVSVDPAEPYGHILNTDGGTFDGIALQAAVRSSLEAAVMADSTLGGVATIGADSRDSQ